MMQKLIMGKASRFYWVAPCPVSGTPSLTLKLAGGDYTVNLAALVPTSYPVMGVDAQGAHVTLSGNPFGATRGLVGAAYGAAFLDLRSQGVHLVEVARVDGSKVYLSTPLPNVCKETGSTLTWAIWSVEIPANQLTEVQRAAEWSVEYTRAESADTPTSAEVDAGECRVVRRPFKTGLTGHSLLNVMPTLRSVQLPSGYTSWQPLVDQGLQRLEVAVEARAAQIRPGAVVDELRGTAFQVAHGKFCALVAMEQLVIAGTYRPEVADVLSEQCEKLLDQIFQGPVWIDADDDGVADAGEVEAQVSPSVVGGAFSDETTFGVNGTLDRFGVGDDR
jgi:hypothetical protein